MNDEKSGGLRGKPICMVSLIVEPDVARRDNLMNEKQIQIIKANLDSKTSEELATIWKNNNQVEYSLEGLESVRRILIERNVTLPDQIPFTPSQEAQAEKNISEARIPLGFGGKSIVLLLGIGIFLFWMCVGGRIKVALFPDPGSGNHYSMSKDLVQAGENRVALDVVVICIAGGLCLVSGIWHLLSKVSAGAKGDQKGDPR